MDDKQKEEITISNFNTENFEENEEDKKLMKFGNTKKIAKKKIKYHIHRHLLNHVKNSLFSSYSTH